VDGAEAGIALDLADAARIDLYDRPRTSASLGATGFSSANRAGPGSLGLGGNLLTRGNAPSSAVSERPLDHLVT